MDLLRLYGLLEDTHKKRQVTRESLELKPSSQEALGKTR